MYCTARREPTSSAKKRNAKKIAPWTKEEVLRTWIDHLSPFFWRSYCAGVDRKNLTY
jgi:hypothetical protein